MTQVPDENDLIYDQYGIDIVGLFRFLYEKVMGGDWQSLLDFIGTLWNIYSVIAILLSILFFTGFMYAKIRYDELREKEDHAIHKGEIAWAERYGGTATTNSRWDEIQQHIREDNPNSWRVAIIEADIFLEEVLTNAGYVGTTIGEKLKSANSASFTTLQDAWDAHKVRNDIAHVGGDFVLTKKVAQETILRFERVFREFGAI